MDEDGAGLPERFRAGGGIGGSPFGGNARLSGFAREYLGGRGRTGDIVRRVFRRRRLRHGRRGRPRSVYRGFGAESILALLPAPGAAGTPAKKRIRAHARVGFRQDADRTAGTFALTEFVRKILSAFSRSSGNRTRSEARSLRPDRICRRQTPSRRPHAAGGACRPPE